MGVLLVASTARAAGDAAEGRKHAQRASHLAASGKCRQALPEFDKALAVLNDPTLLFNRAECHRKLGDAHSALEDYHQFLADLPNAPNRAQVEERIAELRRAPAAVDAERAGSAALGTGSPPARGAETSAASAAVPPASAAAPAGEVSLAPAPPASEPAAVVVAPPVPARAPEGGGGLTRSPLFWIAVAAVVVGAGVGAYFALAQDPTNVPRTDLGNYRF